MNPQPCGEYISVYSDGTGPCVICERTKEEHQSADMQPALKPLTVGELIEKLKAYAPDAWVLTEGCDCTGPCGGIRETTKYARVDRNYDPIEAPRVTVVLERNDDIRLGDFVAQEEEQK